MGVTEFVLKAAYFALEFLESGLTELFGLAEQPPELVAGPARVHQVRSKLLGKQFLLCERLLRLAKFESDHANFGGMLVFDGLELIGEAGIC